MTRAEHTRTPANPLRGLCQGPDKILTFGADVCADPDNFGVQNPDMYVSQSGQFWVGKLSPLGPADGLPWGKKLLLLRFFGAFGYVCAESGQFQQSDQGLCQDPDNIGQWKKFCVRTILDWADTDLLVGLQGS